MSQILDFSGVRYTEKEIEDLCKSALEIRFEAFLEAHPKTRARWEGSDDDLVDKTGSGFDLSMAALLKLGGFSYDDVKAILHPWPHGSQEARSRKNWDRAFQRCWDKADGSGALTQKATISSE